MSGPNPNANTVPAVDSPAERFYAGAPGRIRKLMLVFGLCGVLLCWSLWGRAAAGGFLLGGGIAYINHAWLERMVNALGERITSGHSNERGGIVVFRAVMRYAFIAAGAYVIFRVSPAGLYGFLTGICLTIAAMLCEAAFEIYVALRRGI